jgi:hypothetical protein
MRIVRLHADGPDDLLYVDAEGGTVHITIDMLDVSGELYTSVESTPAQPVDDGAISARAMLVRRRGRQVLRGDVYAVRTEDAPGGPPAGARTPADAVAS